MITIEKMSDDKEMGEWLAAAASLPPITAVRNGFFLLELALARPCTDLEP